MPATNISSSNVIKMEISKMIIALYLKCQKRQVNASKFTERKSNSEN